MLARRGVDSIIASVDAVARRLLDPADPLRQAAALALPHLTGSSAEMVELVLDRMAADWLEPRLRELLAAEFDDPGVLDGFRPRRGLPGVESRALGPRLTFHVFSGNVPGVAVTSLVRALLVKSPSLGKLASGEPLLPALFARGLSEVDPELGSCLAVAYWPGGTGPLERVALDTADTVVVYGSTETVEAVRTRLRPGTRMLAYGHKLSFGLIARDVPAAEAPALAEGAALDVATFDQHGCVSPHLFYVEEGGEITATAWAALLATALERLERDLPRGRVTPGDSAAIVQLRGEMEFASIAGRDVRLHTSAGTTAWTVVGDPDPRFEPSCLNRTVRVKPLPAREHLPRLLGQVGGVVQTVGVAAGAASAASLSEMLARLGATRIAPIGKMAWPAPHWLHDGRPPLGDLVRWCERESGVVRP